MVSRLSPKAVLCGVLSLFVSNAIADAGVCDKTGHSPRVEDGGLDITEAQNYNVTLLEESIDLHYLHRFISESEAASLIRFCDSQPGRWHRSVTRSRKQGDETVHQVKGRISESCGLIFSLFYLDKVNLLREKAPAAAEEFELSWDITMRVATLLQVDKRRIEAIQLLRYGEGGEYRVHHDHRGWYNQADDHERRSMTVLLFLQEPGVGGQLQFPYLNNSEGKPFTIPVRTGDAVYWSNVDAQGVPDKRAMHAGMPVGEGQPKVVANLWIYEKPFTKMPNRR